jgi:TonB family protein
MHEAHGSARGTSLRLPGSWRSGLIVVTAIVICHGAFFYGMAHTRAPRSSDTNAPPMFGPVVSKVWVPPRAAISSKRWEPGAEDQLTPPPRHWKFPPIDLWPSAPGRPATLSEFTPVTDAHPDPPDTQAPLRGERPAAKPAPRRANLQMVRWLRPEYSTDCASPATEGSTVLDLLINATGQPVEITVARSSGSTELDGAASRAASLWRFAPPLWKSRPVEVWGRIELRFHC